MRVIYVYLFYEIKMSLLKTDQVVGLDFNYNGKMIVGIDQDGYAVVTDVDTNDSPAITKTFEAGKNYSFRRGITLWILLIRRWKQIEMVSFA